MKKCINFTGRKRIPQRFIDIEVYDGDPRRFDATIDLAEMAFPDDASVFVEAMCAGSTVVRRYPYGTAAAVWPPLNRDLDQLAGENVFFRIKVVDQSERFGRILGIADNIRPTRAGRQTATGQRRGILPIVEAPLGQELWRIDFGDVDVCLQVNENVPGIKDRARWDKVFHALVYPAVIREILTRAISNNVSDEDESDRWDITWLRFGRHLHPDKESAPIGPQLDDEHWEWIDAVTQSFCNQRGLKDNSLPYIAAREGDDV